VAKAPLRLKRRAEFLRARLGKSAYARGFVLQAVPRFPASVEAELPRARVVGDPSAISYQTGQVQIPIRMDSETADTQPRFGLTVSKRCGGAVRRNRIRRRLKEALRLIDPLPARPGYDYVITARPEARAMAFSALQTAIVRALGKVSASDSSKLSRNRHTLGGTGDPRPQGTTGRTSRR
jgi:ribonuclease P protein component